MTVLCTVPEIKDNKSLSVKCFKKIGYYAKILKRYIFLKEFMLDNTSSSIYFVKVVFRE